MKLSLQNDLLWMLFPVGVQRDVRQRIDVEYRDVKEQRIREMEE